MQQAVRMQTYYATKGNEASTRVKNSNQNYQPRNVQKHSQQNERPPRLRYQIFSMVTIIVALILVTKLQTVHLILETCNQGTIKGYNIEQDSE